MAVKYGLWHSQWWTDGDDDRATFPSFEKAAITAITTS
jgi:hypothetical protein